VSFAMQTHHSPILRRSASAPRSPMPACHASSRRSVILRQLRLHRWRWYGDGEDGRKPWRRNTRTPTDEERRCVRQRREQQQRAAGTDGGHSVVSFLSLRSRPPRALRLSEEGEEQQVFASGASPRSPSSLALGKKNTVCTPSAPSPPHARSALQVLQVLSLCHEHVFGAPHPNASSFDKKTELEINTPRDGHMGGELSSSRVRVLQCAAPCTV
jgi:hypothetical protein